MTNPTNHDLAVQVAKLEERMNTRQAEYEGALDRFRADMDRFRADMDRFRADMADHRADLASRETRITKDIRGEFRSGLMVAVAVIGLVVAIAALLVG